MPSVLNIVKTCNYLKIEYEIMKRLNYRDLLALILDIQIDNKKAEMQQKERQRLADKNVEVVDATNEDILKMHKP